MPRMTIDFPKKSDKVLRDLAKKDETTKVDVLRRALAMYQYIHEETFEKKGKLIIQDKDGKTVKEIVFR